MDINLIDVLESVEKEGAVIKYNGAEGMIVRLSDGTIASDCADGAFFCKKCEELGLDFSHCTIKSRALLDYILENYKVKRINYCTQWVYTKEQAPEADFTGIELLHTEDLPLAGAHYGLLQNSTEYLTMQRKIGRVWGLYVENALAGFIGMHTEGSMGMLEILPEYRRRGYAYRLECFLVDWFLKAGRVPYCHVIDGNEASVALQKKVGLVRAEKPSYWLSGVEKK